LQVLHCTGGGLRNGQIGRIGHGAGLQRHHRLGAKREPSSAAQQPGGGGSWGSGPA